MWQYSVHDGGDVVVVVDDDDGEGVIIIKQMVTLVQTFAGFLLCYVHDRAVRIDTFSTEGIFYRTFFLGYFQKDSNSSSVPVINARHGQSDNDTAGNGGFDWPR